MKLVSYIRPVFADLPQLVNDLQMVFKLTVFLVFDGLQDET